VELVDTARYLVNMSPSSMLVDMIPKEVWYGKNPSVDISKYFSVMCMFPRKRGARWKRRQSNVFSLDINKQ